MKQCQDVDGAYVALTYYNGTLIGLKTKTSKTLASILGFFQTFLKNRKPDFKLIKFIVCPPEKGRVATTDFAQIYKKSYLQMQKPTLFGKEHPPYLDNLLIFRYEPRNVNRMERPKVTVRRRKSVDIFRDLDLNLILREEKERNPGRTLALEGGLAASYKATMGMAVESGISRVGGAGESPGDDKKARNSLETAAKRTGQEITDQKEFPQKSGNVNQVTFGNTDLDGNDPKDLKSSDLIVISDKQDGEAGVKTEPGNLKSSQSIPPSAIKLNTGRIESGETGVLEVTKPMNFPTELQMPKARPSIFKSMLDFKDKLVDNPKEGSGAGGLGSLWSRFKTKEAEAVNLPPNIPSDVEDDDNLAPNRNLLLDTIVIPKKQRKVSFFEPTTVELAKNDYKIDEEVIDENLELSQANDYRVDNDKPENDGQKEANLYEVKLDSLVGNPNEYSIQQ